MPPTEKDQPADEQSLVQIATELGLYPVDAFSFVEQGLSYTVAKIHGELAAASQNPQAEANDPSRHISGQQLCEGLRQFALLQWGLLARTVLRRWNITCTYDFGRIVFALVSAQRMQKTEHDNIEDFRDVFDFKVAFESDYRIEHKS
jgi:uncharacterized repeat protein (TIGR04138 family)